MLEFYPMPTNLNHAGGLYSHHSHQLQHQHHSAVPSPAPAQNQQLHQHQQQLHHSHMSPGGALRFSDNPVAVNLNNNNAICGQQQTMNISPMQAACAPSNNNHTNNSHNLNNNNNNNHNNNNNNNSNNSNNNNNNNNTNNINCLSPTSVSTASKASLTAQAISAAAVGSGDANAIRTAGTCGAASTALSCATVAAASAASAPTSANVSAIVSASSSSSLSSTSSLSSSLCSSTSSSSTPKLPADCSGRTEVGHIKCEKNYEICEGCGQKIHDRYLMNVGDANWHEQCLACCYCGLQLHHTCYVRNTKLYCKLDYDRLFGIKCSTCCHPILPQELVMRPIPNFIFHLSCFVCYACRLPLQKGEQFMLRDGQLFCYRHDLEKEMYLAAAAAAQHCGYVGGLDDEDLMRPRDGRRGPKRPRTILTSQQRKQFKASFDQSPKPCRKVREALAKDTGLSVRVVQVWFQNQRAKMKKIQRKAKNSSCVGGGGTGSGGSGGAAGEKDKDGAVIAEKDVKQEASSASENGYLSLDSAFASQPLNPNLPFSPNDYPAHSNDSFCSSDLSLDGSNFDQLDDDADSLSLNNLELQSTGSSGNHHQHSNPHDMIANLSASLINPIDKLYLMQNSYFSAEQ